MIPISLSACSSHSSLKTDFVMPPAPVYDTVEIISCEKNLAECEKGMKFCMSSQDFKKLMGNIVKDRIYQNQLLNLLKSLKTP